MSAMSEFILNKVARTQNWIFVKKLTALHSTFDAEMFDLLR